MDYLNLLAKVIHVISAAFWAGSVLLMAAVFRPAAAKLGNDINKSFQQIIRESKYGQRMAIAGWATIFSGLALYFSSFKGIAPLTSLAIVGLTIGAISGIVALYIGVFMQSKVAKEISLLSKELSSKSDNPDKDLMGKLTSLRRKNATLGIVTGVLLTISLVGMSL